MSNIAKLFLLIGILVILVAVLVVSIADARYRGKMTYCRNNLRWLGQLAVSYIRDSGDEKMPFRGRKFWLDVVVNRDPVTQEVKGSEWERAKAKELDMLVCPVFGKTESLYGRVENIDYRGPANEPSGYKKGDAFGSDREGNHGADGCNVLFIDLTVRDIKEGIIVRPYSRSALGEGVIRTTSD